MAGKRLPRQRNARNTEEQQKEMQLAQMKTLRKSTVKKTKPVGKPKKFDLKPPNKKIDLSINRAKSA
jgi:hypothetical protein